MKTVKLVLSCLLALGSLHFLTSCATDSSTANAQPPSTRAGNENTYPSTYTPPSSAYTGRRY